MGAHTHKKGHANVNGKQVKQQPKLSKSFFGGSNVHNGGSRGQSGQPKRG